ncbi:MAG: tetratricopeptide repeat protein [Myxococcota bacterium]
MIALALSLALSAASPNPFLAEAKTLYTALDFERCLERLEQASKKWTSTPKELFEIEVYSGLARFNLGQVKQAAEHFRVAQRIDPAGELPPYSSPKAVDLWLEVKQSLVEPPPPFPDSDLPADDTPRRTDLKPPVKDEPVSPRPAVEWRRHAAPVALTVVAAAAFAVAIGLGASARSFEARANAAYYESDFVSLGNAARANATGANVSWALAAVAALTAGVLWWVDFNPAPSPSR